MKQLTDTFPNDVRFIYRNFPLTSIHDKASLSSQAAEAANLQGKYWEMHEALFDGEKWNTWASMSADDFKTWLIQEATALGLDVTKFTTDLTSDAVVNKVKADETAAQSAGMGGTPAFFILMDNQLIFTPDDQLYHDFATHKAILTLWKFEKQKYTECPPVGIDTNKQYTATIKTSKGDVMVELFAKAAPLTVNSFVFLAKAGWFNNIPWHRVIDGFVAQSGDPSGTGMGGPGYEFGDEISADLNFDTEGVVGMANSGSGTNGSQFFITLAAASDLNGRYTIFGKVLSGMDVLKSLTKVDPTQANQPTPDSIISITISEQ